MWYSPWKRRPSRRTADSRRVRPCLECLEERVVPSAMTVVYTESNNPTPGQNAVLEFHQNSNGSLTQIASFNTGGTGLPSAAPVIGPADSSTEVLTSPDGRFLFAVNQGSNSVSAFRIDRDGSLDLIGTFDSGGVQPDSLALSGDKLYVSNRGDSAVGTPGTVTPNITGFRIRGDGVLAPIPGSTVTFDPNTSPSQNLISPDGRLLFADIFAVPDAQGLAAPGGNTLASFRIEGNGKLDPVSEASAPLVDSSGHPLPPPLLLGASFNPHAHIIYAGLAARNEVAVFTYDKSGNLTFVGDSPLSMGGLTPCWTAVSADGKFLYVGDNGTDSVGVFSLADPLHPVEIQEFFLGGPGNTQGALQTKTFQIVLSPDGHTLYAIGQTTDGAGGFPDGNQLHALSVARDGMLSEPSGPFLLDTAGVPGDAFPQGIAVLTFPGHRYGWDD